ncbi:MAG: hypothetical protein U9N87_07090, partial [Planctomycetota bacterium]|nr:hypothetical protein [Planctomycetota bacterium]
ETIYQPATSSQPGGMLLKPTAHKSPYLAPGSGNMPGPRSMTAQQHTASRHARPSNRYMPSNPNRAGTPGPNSTPGAAGDQKTLPGFMGPVGYDVVR